MGTTKLKIINEDPVEVFENLLPEATIIGKHIKTETIVDKVTEESTTFLTELSYCYKTEQGIYLIVNAPNIRTETILTENELGNNTFSFDTIEELMSYLRQVKSDPAINYDLRNIAKPLISQLYRNRKVEIDNVLDV